MQPSAYQRGPLLLQRPQVSKQKARRPRKCFRDSLWVFRSPLHNRDSLQGSSPLGEGPAGTERSPLPPPSILQQARGCKGSLRPNALACLRLGNYFSSASFFMCLFNKIIIDGLIHLSHNQNSSRDGAAPVLYHPSENYFLSIHKYIHI